MPKQYDIVNVKMSSKNNKMHNNDMSCALKSLKNKQLDA